MKLIVLCIINLMWFEVLFAQVILPPRPALVEPVHQVETERNAYLNPVISPLRVSFDGRIGVNPKIINNGNLIQFYLNIPENIDTQFLESGAGPEILKSASYNINSLKTFISPQEIYNSGKFIHTTLCDPTGQDTNQESKNPYICRGGTNDGTSRDCYDLELISSFNPEKSLGSEEEVWLFQTPITVRVKNPKSSDAQIESISLRENGSFRKITINGVKSIFEPIVSGSDKRFFIARTANSDITYMIKNNEGLSVKRTKSHDIVYSVGENMNACDISGFNNLYPLSHAPYDDEVKNRYGFAKHIFRDTLGKEIQDGEEMNMTYPWVDNKANNIVAMGVNSKLYNKGVPRFTAECVVQDGCTYDNDAEYSDKARGHVFLGLWTSGKMVYLDTPIQATDFGLKADAESHRNLNLYRNGPPIRVGTGRDAHRDRFGGLTKHTYNSSFFESIENKFNHLPNFIPRSPRDVVWYISSGQRTHEFAFDDMISHRVLIYSPMNAALELDDSSSSLMHQDGFNLDENQYEYQNIKLQNASSTILWKTPRFGEIRGSGSTNVRTEPVPLGGYNAKGFYTYANSSINYLIPSQDTGSSLLAEKWYIGFFIDSRFNSDNEERVLLDMPHGGQVKLIGRDRIIFTTASEPRLRRVRNILPLPEASWGHLGISYDPSTAELKIFRDGFLNRTISLLNTETEVDISATSFRDSFRLIAGNLSFAEGIDAWVDDFILKVGSISKEEACNQADGTLLGLKNGYLDNYINSFREKASQFPMFNHKELQEELVALGAAGLMPEGQYFVCNTNYNNTLHVNSKKIPIMTFSVKESLLFNEGPIISSRVRPDSSENNFCLSCHDPKLKDEFSTHALLSSSSVNSNYVNMHIDPRRQPMHPQPILTGVVPDDYISQFLTFYNEQSDYLYSNQSQIQYAQNIENTFGATFSIDEIAFSNNLMGQLTYSSTSSPPVNIDHEITDDGVTLYYASEEATGPINPNRGKLIYKVKIPYDGNYILGVRAYVPLTTNTRDLYYKLNDDSQRVVTINPGELGFKRISNDPLNLIKGLHDITIRTGSQDIKIESLILRRIE